MWCTPQFVFRETVASQEKGLVNCHIASSWRGGGLRVKETELSQDI